MNDDLTEEKKSEYTARRNERLRQQRESWRQAVASGDYSGRNLEFLVYICRSMGLNRRQFAARLGRTQQTIDYWLISDDIHLSILQASFRQMGLRLECRLELKEDSPLRRPVREEVAHSLVTVHKSEQGRFDYSVTMPKMEIEPQPAKFGGAAGNIPEDARLYFLAEVMRECGLRLRQFCQITKVGYMKLFKNLVSDDILVSTINEIAANGGLSVGWSLTPLGEKQQKK